MPEIGLIGLSLPRVLEFRDGVAAGAADRVDWWRRSTGPFSAGVRTTRWPGLALIPRATRLTRRGGGATISDFPLLSKVNIQNESATREARAHAAPERPAARILRGFVGNPDAALARASDHFGGCLATGGMQRWRPATQRPAVPDQDHRRAPVAMGQEGFQAVQAPQSTAHRLS